ncbi:MAG: hypothetical protein ACK5B9_10465 [Flavobacteriia bacterium]|jgi:hypothetical protein
MKFFILLSISLLASCAMFKSKNSKYQVSGKIEIHKPYCGGAKPTPEIAKGEFEPYANATFYVKTQMNNDKKLETVLKFKTDSKGNYKFKIKKGTYVVVHEDKMLSFEQYKEKYSKPVDQLLEYVGDKEAKEHYERLDFSIDVQGKKDFSYTYQTKCFCGMNPLMKYIGPKPM